MEHTTSLWLFNLFTIVMLGWLFFYFYSMFHAIADLNDSLIAIIQKAEDKEDMEGQTKLSDFIEE